MHPEQTPITGKEDKKEMSAIHKALSDFYEAFNTRSMEKMAASWAQSDEISMDNPLGGIKRGWDEIRSVYERIFSGAAEVYVEFYDYTIHQSGDVFFAVGRERGEFRLDENSVPLAIRTSRIFRLLEGQWRQMHHHGSIEDPDLLDRYQKAVRQDSQMGH